MGFTFIHKPCYESKSADVNSRTKSKGGGVVFFVDDRINSSVLEGPGFNSFEYIMVSSKLGLYNFKLLQFIFL